MKWAVAVCECASRSVRACLVASAPGIAGGGRGMAISVVVLLSALFAHELGHALGALAFGSRATVVLHALGGYTQVEPRLPRRQEIVTSLMGPVASIALGALLYWAHFWLPGHAWLPTAIRVNLAWGVLHLLPVLPFDGGKILLSTLGVARHGRAPAGTHADRFVLLAERDQRARGIEGKPGDLFWTQISVDEGSANGHAARAPNIFRGLLHEIFGGAKGLDRLRRRAEHLTRGVEHAGARAARADIHSEKERRAHRSALAQDADLEAELLRKRQHFLENVAVCDGYVVRQIMRHQRVAGDAHVGRHERPLARGAFPPLVAHGLGQFHDLTATDVHPQHARANVRARPRHFSGQAFARQRSAGRREI
jgi:hypothetical protein